MEDGAEFYMSPIPAGYYRYTDIIEGGALHIEDIAECVDAMACEAENRRRLEEWQSQQR